MSAFKDFRNLKRRFSGNCFGAKNVPGNFFTLRFSGSENDAGDPPNPVRGLSEHSLLLGDACFPRGAGCQGWVENGGFCMLSGTLPAPGARNANFMLIPASPGLLLHRPPRFPGESAGFTNCPWSIFPTSTSIRCLLHSYASYGVFEGRAFSLVF